MTEHHNVRLEINGWMRRHPVLAIFGPHVICAAFGLLLGIGAGIWLQNTEAAIYLGLSGALVGGLVGPFVLAIPMAAAGFLLMLFYPSHRGYLALSVVVAVISASVAGFVHGYTVQDWTIAAAVYGGICLIACEMCGSVYKQCNRLRRSSVGRERDLGSFPQVETNRPDQSVDSVEGL